MLNIPKYGFDGGNCNEVNTACNQRSDEKLQMEQLALLKMIEEDGSLYGRGLCHNLSMIK